jgi:hypothetical protein
VLSLRKAEVALFNISIVAMVKRLTPNSNDESTTSRLALKYLVRAFTNVSWYISDPTKRKLF